MSGGIGRRGFLKAGLVGGAGSVVLAGCKDNEREIHKVISQLETPAEITPGRATWYASACTACEAGCGIHVRVMDGRAKKVEGAPDHPVSQGGLCVRGQALVQALYHPDRTGGAMLNGAAVKWDAAQAELKKRLEAAARKGPGRVALIGPGFPGALGAVAEAFTEHFNGHPPLTWNALYTPNAPEPPTPEEIAGIGAIVNFGAPLLESGKNPVGWAKAIAAMRSRPGRRGLFVHIGPRMGATGAAADVWVPAKAGRTSGDEMLLDVEGSIPGLMGEQVAEAMGVELDVLLSLRGKLREAGTILSVGGDSPWTGGPHYDALRHLADHVASAGIDVLLHVGGNPFQRAPKLMNSRNRQPAFRVALTSRDVDATGADLVLRTHTTLEDWGSQKGACGVTLQQPAVSPRWDTRGVGDLLLAAMGRESMREFVLRHHAPELKEAGLGFDQALGAGGVYTSGPSAPTTRHAHGRRSQSGDWTLLAYEAATTGDGRLAHTPWLQEAREPISGGFGPTWAELSPNGAARVGAREGGRVRLTTQSGALDLPVRVHPGQRDDVVSVPIGQDPGGPTDPLPLFARDGLTAVKIEALA